MCFICKGSSPGTWITLKCLVNKAKCYFSGLCCNFSKALRARFSFSFWLKSHMNATFLLSTYAPLYSLKYFVTHSCTFWYCSAIVTKSRCQQRHLGMLSVWGRSRHWAVQHSQTPELCLCGKRREGTLLTMGPWLLVWKYMEEAGRGSLDNWVVLQSLL